jgi:hypothetical protein
MITPDFFAAERIRKLEALVARPETAPLLPFTETLDIAPVQRCNLLSEAVRRRQFILSGTGERFDHLVELAERCRRQASKCRGFLKAEKLMKLAAAYLDMAEDLVGEQP